jgi:site-specific DNA-adenine methylase
VQRAARCYYLNQTCINALMRIGPNGYNMAAGDTRAFVPEDLAPYSLALQGTGVYCHQALEVIAKARAAKRVLLIVDPPYFDQDPNKYQFSRQFPEKHQKELVRLLRTGPHPFVYSNKLSPLIERLWKGHAQQVEMGLQHKVGPAAARAKQSDRELWCWRI